MKKILIGICGIGNGHFERQKAIINYLLSHNDNVVIASTGTNLSRIRETYPMLDVLEIVIPWVFANGSGVNFKSTLEVYKNINIDIYGEFLKFAVNVEKAFHGKPDVVISDYEPNVAQYAYATGLPLINMEQQSKYLFIKEMDIKGYSIMEEVSRINYFFPKTSMRVLSSFFPLDINDSENVVCLPPVIETMEKKDSVENKIIVYLSPYCSEAERYKKLLDEVVKLKDYFIKVYTNIEFERYQFFENVCLTGISNSFKEDVSNAKFVISTAGHQLISELIMREIPMCLFPLDTYEQHYNAEMVRKYGLGKVMDRCSIDEIRDFTKCIDEYVLNIRKYKKRYLNRKWEDIFDEKVGKRFGI